MRQHCQVYDGDPVADRLAELGLKAEFLEFALRGADAEARTYTELDPPNMQGMARYSRTVRLLREQLVPLGWSFDNPRNLARTVSPDRRVAIIALFNPITFGEVTFVNGRLVGTGFGGDHEVIVESSNHDATFDSIDAEEVVKLRVEFLLVRLLARVGGDVGLDEEVDDLVGGVEDVILSFAAFENGAAQRVD